MKRAIGKLLVVGIGVMGGCILASQQMPILVAALIGAAFGVAWILIGRLWLRVP